MEAHLGSSIDDFTVNFDLDINNELTIDKWVVFALSKQVKRIELNFTPAREYSDTLRATLGRLNVDYHLLFCIVNCLH